MFPGQQGGPLEHVIAGKAVAFKIAASAEFKERQQRVLAGARILAERLVQPDVTAKGINVISGGTDVHLVLVDLRNCELDGQQAEDRLAEIDITVNRNAVPFDPRPPMVTSGLRIGTPALATRGFGEAAFAEVADIIAEALMADAGTDLSGLRSRVEALAARPPALPFGCQLRLTSNGAGSGSGRPRFSRVLLLRRFDARFRKPRPVGPSEGAGHPAACV